MSLRLKTTGNLTIKLRGTHRGSTTSQENPVFGWPECHRKDLSTRLRFAPFQQTNLTQKSVYDLCHPLLCWNSRSIYVRNSRSLWSLTEDGVPPTLLVSTNIFVFHLNLSRYIHNPQTTTTVHTHRHSFRVTPSTTELEDPYPGWHQSPKVYPGVSQFGWFIKYGNSPFPP